MQPYITCMSTDVNACELLQLYSVCKSMVLSTGHKHRVKQLCRAPSQILMHARLCGHKRNVKHLHRSEIHAYL